MMNQPRNVTKFVFIFATVLLGIECAPVPPLNPIQKSRKLSQIAQNHLIAEKYSLAEKEYREALQLYPENEIAAEHLSLLYLQQGRFREAEVSAKNAIALHSGSSLAHYVLASCLHKNNKNKFALEVVKKALILAQRPRDKKKAEKLLREIQHAYNPKTEHEDPFVRATKFFERNDWKNAEEKLRKVISAQPENVKAQEFLSLLLLRKAHYKEAERIAHKIINQNKQSAIAYFVLSKVLHRRGDKLNARPLYKKAKKFATLKEKALFERFSEYGGGGSHEPSKEIRKKNVQTFTPIPIEKRIKIAVFTFEDANAKSKEMTIGESVSEMMTTAFVQTQRFNVIERMQLEKIFNEQKLNISRALDAETAIELGKLLGVKAVILGSVSMLSKVIESDARVIDVETAQAYVAVNGKCNNIEKLRILAETMVGDITTKVETIDAWKQK